MDVQALILAFLVCAAIVVIVRGVMALVPPKEPIGLIVWTIIALICIMLIFGAVTGHAPPMLYWGSHR